MSATTVASVLHDAALVMAVFRARSTERTRAGLMHAAVALGIITVQLRPGGRAR